MRIAAFVKKRLADRRSRDAKRTKARHHETYYLNAALAAIPSDPAEARQWVEEYLDRLEDLGITRPGTTSMSTRAEGATIEHLEEVTENLRSAARYGLSGALQSAAVLRLLDALDALDEQA